MKAIETVYNGYKFRSRLEARWAVFFDALGVEYEYEPEGYEIESRGKYLPDFFLPEDEVYIEIKPTINKKTWKQIKKDPQKWLQFSECINKKIFVFFGQPFPYKMDAFFTMKFVDHSFRWFFWRYFFFAVVENALYLCFHPKATDRTAPEIRYMWGVPDSEKDPLLMTFLCQIGYPAPPDGLYEPVEACKAARQARFEFGENGKNLY